MLPVIMHAEGTVNIPQITVWYARSVYSFSIGNIYTILESLRPMFITSFHNVENTSRYVFRVSIFTHVCGLRHPTADLR